MAFGTATKEFHSVAGAIGKPITHRRVESLLGHVLVGDGARLPRVTNACANLRGKRGAWPDLLRVAAMNRHCVARSRGRKTAELCFSSHERERENETEQGDERPRAERDRGSARRGKGVRRRKKKPSRDRRGREVLDDERTPGTRLHRNVSQA